MLSFVSNILLFLHRVLPLPWHARHQENKAHFRHHFTLHTATFSLGLLTFIGIWIPVALSSDVAGWEFFSYSVSGGAVEYVGVRGAGLELTSASELKSLDSSDLPWMTSSATTSTMPLTVLLLYWAPLLNLLTFWFSGPVCWLIDYGMHVHQHHQPHDEVRTSASLFACAMGVWVCGAEAFTMYVGGTLHLLPGAVIVDFVPGTIYWLQGIWVIASALWAYAMYHRIKKEGPLNGYESEEVMPLIPERKASS